MVFSGFPGGSVVKNSPATGVSSLIREDQNAKDQLGPWATITEPALLSLGAAITEACGPQSLCSAAPETTAMKSLIESIRARWSRICKPMRETRDSVRLLGGKDPWEKETSNSFRYSCLKNSMDRGTWWATVHGGCEELDMTKHAPTHLKPARQRRHPAQPINK